MANKPVQTFENHVRQDPVVTTVLVMNVAVLIIAIVALAMDNTRVAAAGLVIAGVALVNSRYGQRRLFGRMPAESVTAEAARAKPA